MTNPIIRELERQQREEQAAREATLAAEVWAALAYVAPEIAPDMIERVRPFMTYCTACGVNYLPARPETVAAFLLAHIDMVPSADRVLDILMGIEAMHDAHSLASPVKSSVVAAVLARLPGRDPPRSWPDSDKLLFMSLPLMVQHVIGRREAQRDKALQRALAEQRNPDRKAA